MARGELPARDAPPDADRRRHLLGRPALEISIRRAAPMARTHGSEGLDGARVAARVRRRRPLARRGKNSAPGDARAQLPLAARQLRHLDARTRAAEVRQRRTEARASAENRARRNSMVPGLLRTRLGLRPRVVANPRRGQRRSVPRQRLEDLDLLRRQSRLDFLPGAHRPQRAQARRHQLSAVRHGKRGRLDQADHSDLGRVAVLPDFLRRRAGAEGEPRRQAQQGMGHREIPADP